MCVDRPKLGFGVGLRAEHYAEIGADDRGGKSAGVDWFEAITENYMDTGGRPLAVLERLRRERPIALHGVGLSIGSAEPTDARYLAQLERLVERIEPALVTDHLCWTGVGKNRLYDLLPLPYTEETLHYVAAKIRFVQDALGRQIALENPSRYVAFAHSTIDEAEFLAALAEEADCALLLDVNNVYVSAANLGMSAECYLDALPRDRIAQIHLAGFTDTGTYLFDTHSAPVHPDVWRLYEHAVGRFGEVATLVEWDAEIPSFERLAAEVDIARDLARKVLERDRHERTTQLPERSPQSAGDIVGVAAETRAA
jgi:uncharacterized protein (UPF0276 family)